MCKRGDMLSLAVLIGRGLDLVYILLLSFLYFFPFVQFLRCEKYLKVSTISSVGRAPDS